MTRKFFKCKKCGNIVTLLHNSGVPVSCCGEPMTELIAGTSDGAAEKHVPAVEIEGNKVTVKVGSVAHPMLPEHHIEFVWLETEKGEQVKHLEAGMAPEATFTIADDDKFVAAYEYCNLHGLWKAE